MKSTARRRSRRRLPGKKYWKVPVDRWYSGKVLRLGIYVRPYVLYLKDIPVLHFWTYQHAEYPQAQR